MRERETEEGKYNRHVGRQRGQKKELLIMDQNKARKEDEKHEGSGCVNQETDERRGNI